MHVRKPTAAKKTAPKRTTEEATAGGVARKLAARRAATAAKAGPKAKAASLVVQGPLATLMKEKLALLQDVKNDEALPDRTRDAAGALAADLRASLKRKAGSDPGEVLQRTEKFLSGLATKWRQLDLQATSGTSTENDLAGSVAKDYPFLKDIAHAGNVSRGSQYLNNWTNVDVPHGQHQISDHGGGLRAFKSKPIFQGRAFKDATRRVRTERDALVPMGGAAVVPDGRGGWRGADYSPVWRRVVEWHDETYREPFQTDFYLYLKPDPAGGVTVELAHDERTTLTRVTSDHMKPPVQEEEYEADVMRVDARAKLGGSARAVHTEAKQVGDREFLVFIVRDTGKKDLEGTVHTLRLTPDNELTADSSPIKGSKVELDRALFGRAGEKRKA